MSSTCPHNMVNFGLLAAEIGLRVWGTPANFHWFLRLGSVTARHLVVGVSQTLRRWTDGATYIRQGDHHVGHWPTLLVGYRVWLKWLQCCWKSHTSHVWALKLNSTLDWRHLLYNVQYSPWSRNQPFVTWLSTPECGVMLLFYRQNHA